MFQFAEENSRSSARKRFMTFFLSLLAHIVAIFGVVMLPLIFFRVLPGGDLLTFLIAAPLPPPPLVPRSEPRSTTKPTADRKLTHVTIGFSAPSPIPNVLPVPQGELLITGLPGIPSGISGGVYPGVPGGSIWSPRQGLGEPLPPPPPPPPRREKKEPVRIGGNIQEPKLVKRVEPVYPELAKKARISGVVILQVTVDEEGIVSDVRVLRGRPLLDEEAVRAVKQWRYTPTLLNGEPVPVIATVTVIFNLR